MCDNSHCKKNTNKLLIDFNGPLQTQLEAVTSGHLIPLVPPPIGPVDSPSNTSTCAQTILDGDGDSDVDNNPFDSVIHQTNLNVRMLNDPFELVYQRAYHLPTENYEVNDKSPDSYVTNTNVKEVSTTVPVKTVTSLQDIRSTTGNFKANAVYSNDVAQILEHLNEDIGEFNTEDSLIFIEDVTDPTGHMSLSLSDTSCVSKQLSATERRNESSDLNFTNTINVYQPVENSNGIFHTKTVENGQNIVENNSFVHIRSSCCNGYNGEQNYFSAGCIHRKTERDVLSPSQEVTLNSNSHTDEELKAIVASRISACIQNALGQTKLPTKETWISDHNSSSHITAAAPVKTIVVPHVQSSLKHSDAFPFASSEIRKTNLPAALNGDMDASVEVLQMLCQQGNENSVNTILASSMKTPLDRLKLPTRSSGSTASVESYGELNKAFCTFASSHSEMNTSPDLLCDRSFSDVRGIISVSGSTEKFSFLKCANNNLEVNMNGALNSFGNELYCSSSCEHKNVTADGRKIETVIEKYGKCGEETVSSVGKDVLQVENTDQKKHDYINLAQENSLHIDKNTSTCSPSNNDDYLAGNIYIRRLSSSLCVGSSDSNKNEEIEGDDTVFLEANTLAFVFSKAADSFSQLTSSDGEEDILTCKPQWEVSQLNLPKFNSEEDGAEQVENSNLLNVAKTKIDGDERRQVTGLPPDSMTPDHKYRHKKPSSQKKFDVSKKSECSSTSSESSATSHSSKQSSGSCSSSSTPPLSKQRIQGLSLRSRLLSSVDKKLSKVVPHILPPPLKVMVDEAGKNTRLKPKRKQEVGKRGPMKAVVPVDNMTRASGLEKKGEQAEVHVLKANFVVTSTPKPLVRSPLNHETEAKNTPILPAKSCQKKSMNPAALSMLESRTVTVKKDSSGINRSFTALSSPSCVPIMRRSNSLTSGIPSLASPVSLLNQPSSCDNNSVPVSSKENSKTLLNVQPTTPVRKQSSCQIPTLGSQQKSKSSSTIPQFNVSGLAVTSTPTRNNRYTSPNCSTIEYLPSPIPVRDVREKSSLQTGTSESVKTVAVPRNISADSFQQKEKTKSVSKHHGRSKSASNIQPPRDKRTSLTKNHSDRSKIHISSDNSTACDNDVKKDRSKSPGFKMGISKPLVMKNLNNQYAASKENQKDLSSHASGNDQRKAKSLLQIYSKLKRSAAVPTDKENVNPSCEICL